MFLVLHITLYDKDDLISSFCSSAGNMTYTSLKAFSIPVQIADKASLPPPTHPQITFNLNFALILTLAYP